MKVRAQLAKESLCKCGAHVQKDNVPLGTEYIIETNSIRNGYMVCECGKIIPCHVVFAEGGVSKSSGIIALEILEIDEGIAI